MAINKTLPTPISQTQISIDFWRVRSRVFDDQKGLTEVTVGGWVRKADYTAGYLPLATRSYTLDYTATKGLNQSQMEQYILANVAEFNGGIYE